MEKVIPPGLNYADIKPEAIENQIRMIKFLPISNVQNQKPNDVVRFHLQGNGFFDPYSAYIKIRVQCDKNSILQPDAADGISGKFLDRSAHSLINRLVIRSQGTELERIEQYDVMAAMINDVIYSQEQRQMHDFEGFASKQIVHSNYQAGHDLYSNFATAMKLLNTSSPAAAEGHFADSGFFKTAIAARPVATEEAKAEGVKSADLKASSGFDNLTPIGLTDYGQVVNLNDFAQFDDTTGKIVTKQGPGCTLTEAGLTTYTSPMILEFCIPIYSGIIGVMQPDKKLLPLSLMPLEVEFTLNPQAFYPVGKTIDRDYTIASFEIWTHTLFFEQELHRSLEAVVAENGIFIHYTSFYLTPINSYNNDTIPKYHQLGCFLKSVDALHWVFLYSSQYTQANGPRKLNFVSHNLYNLQLRNGMDLIPSEPLQAGPYRGDIGNPVGGIHNQLQIEMYKSWNKMHDPALDGAISCFNFCVDEPYIYDYDKATGIIDRSKAIIKPANVYDMVRQQLQVGRCQYGLSLIGEELGQNKTIVSGKKTVLPFDLNFDGHKSIPEPSMMLCYLQADFIIYVRPDLVVTRLGL